MTTPLEIAAFYIALNAIVTFVLAIRAAMIRGKTNILLGDGGNEVLLRATRAHGNNIEYVPLILLMLVAMALMESSALYLHIVGLGLLIGRTAHGYGVTAKSGPSIGRVVGMVFTLVPMLVGIAILLKKAAIF